MNSNPSIKIIDDILAILCANDSIDRRHYDSYKFLIAKYSDFKDAVLNKKNVSEFVEWNKWFAPRIVFEGINDKKVLELQTRLTEEMEQNP